MVTVTLWTPGVTSTIFGELPTLTPSINTAPHGDEVTPRRVVTIAVGGVGGGGGAASADGSALLVSLGGGLVAEGWVGGSGGGELSADGGALLVALGGGLVAEG